MAEKPLNLVEIQGVELNVLKSFDQFCQQYKLRYWLAYGTLLGAVRHQGFIPWDDDVDVVMPDRDYRKMIKLLEKGAQFNGGYLLYDQVRNPDSRIPFAKLFDTKTLAVEGEISAHVDEDFKGLWVDIFPLYGCYDNSRKMKIWQRELDVYFAFARLASWKFKPGKSILGSIARFLMYVPARLIGYRYFSTKVNRMLAILPRFDNSETVTLGYSQGYEYPKEWFSTTHYLPFEDTKLPVPGAYTQVLENDYGDYQTIPPEEERSVHQLTAYWR